MISLECGSEAFRIRVTDDGTGFDLRSTNPTTNGYGLRIMRERVEGVGGRMTLRSELGKGTEVEFVLSEEAGDPAPGGPADP